MTGTGTRSRVVLGAVLTAVIVAAAGGWVLARQIRSPAEIAARTAPPDPSLISVPVEKRPLTSDVVVRGTVGYGSPLAVTIPKSVLKPAATIVTTAPVKGAPLAEGAVALTMSGRPVLVLQGAQPAYRDLGPGTEGADVSELEAGLARLGFDPGPVDGRYDGSTATAVAAWYRAGGWEPFGPTDEQVTARQSREADLFSARLERLGAEEQAGSARSTRAGTGADVQNKTNAVAAAVETERKADVELAQAAGAATDPGQLAGLDAAVRDAAGATAVARSDLAAAQASVSDGDQAVAVAEERLSITGAREQTLSEELLAAVGSLGTQVPADEVLFFPSLPLRVDDVPIRAGEEPTGPVMTVTNSQVVVSAALAPNDAKLVRPGAPVGIDEPDLAVHASGTVTDVAATPGTLGVDPGRFHLGVASTDAPPSLVGASVVLTITVGTTGGDVLAVPVAALSVAGDGTTRVQVSIDGGKTREVAVTPGLAARGTVAVTPVTGSLAPGDLVVVGTTGGKPHGK